MFTPPKDIKNLNLKAPYVWLATWFGAGFFRPGPGTWGSIASIPPAIIVFLALGIKGILIGILIISAIGYWAAGKFDQATGGHDNKMIVIDEAAGQWITLVPALYLLGLNPLFTALALLFFRIFDILKPWPISYIDKKMSGPLSVMGDDILAGLISAGLLTGIIHYAGLG